MLYPIKLRPIFKLRLWGNRRFEALFGLNLPVNQNVGELWSIADHGPDSNYITNGPLAGQTLGQIREAFPLELMGRNCNPRRFPLLVKVLDAHNKLSIQVHPDDAYASRHESDSGKSELWYVIDAVPGAEIIYGLKPGVNSIQLTEAIQQHTIDSLLNRVTVKPGDTFYIPAGLVHALGAGMVVAEIQQNSDLTYRLYDYNRLDKNGLPRELHVQKALAVIQCDLPPAKVDLLNTFTGDYFSVNVLKVQGFSLITNPSAKMWVWVILQGSGQVSGGGEIVEIKAGDALVFPASLTGAKAKGNFSALRSSPSPSEPYKP